MNRKEKNEEKMNTQNDLHAFTQIDETREN